MEDSPVVGVPLEKLPLIDHLLVACINPEGTDHHAPGKDTIEPGDTVIIVTTHTGLNDLGDIIK